MLVFIFAQIFMSTPLLETLEDMKRENTLAVKPLGIIYFKYILSIKLIGIKMFFADDRDALKRANEAQWRETYAGLD